MARRRTFQWMEHVLQMDEDCLPWQVFDCSLARSVAEDGRMKQLKLRLKLRPGHRNIEDISEMYSPAIRGCHEEDTGEIRAAAAERAVDRQAWRDAFKNLALLEFKKPQQAGRVTWSCAQRGRSGPGLVDLCNDCDLATEDMEYCFRKSQCKE
eukprot:366083-Chlamydomonas_euryale.AAC.9